MVHRQIEKALNLSGVQIHRQHAICTGTRDHVGHQLCRNRYSTFVFAILPCVTKVGNHSRDPFRAGSFARVDQDQQFHQVVVNRRASGLQQVDIPASNIFDLAMNLSIGERRKLTIAQRQIKELGDVFGKLRIGSATEELKLAHRDTFWLRELRRIKLRR